MTLKKRNKRRRLPMTRAQCIALADINRRQKSPLADYDGRVIRALRTRGYVKGVKMLVLTAAGAAVFMPRLTPRSGTDEDEL